MSSYDIHTKISEVESLELTAIEANETTLGTEIDTAGFESCEFIVSVMAYYDGTYAFSLEDSDTSGSGYAAVDSELVFLKDASLGAAGITRLGYVGHKRYVKLSIVSTGISTQGATLYGVAVLGNPKYAATA